MAKHEKHEEKKSRVINLDDYRKKAPSEPAQEAEAELEYEDIFSGDEEESEAQRQKRRELRQLPKAVYIVSLVLLVAVVGLSLWINREHLTWDNIRESVKLQVKGEEIGDGFPVPITGANVYEGNFLSYDGGVVTLSNTALTAINSTGTEKFSVRHNLSAPVMRSAGNRYLLFNSGSKGYMALSGGRIAAEGAAETDILAGGICPGGRFALGLESSYGASKLEVYMADGSLQYEYPFSNDYITAIAMNYDGTYGAVCTVRSEKGEMVSKLSIFDFNQEEPVAEYETRENFLFGAYWAENGSIYGVGDAALVCGLSGSYEFSEYGYQGRQLTAFSLSSGRAFLSVSAYEHGGTSTLLVFNGGEKIGEKNPVRVEMEARVEAISTSGGTVGVLMGGEAVFLDYITGMELGRTEAGEDANGIALGSERRAYILGVSEIRTAEIS
ncbi:DUF5711 family protein [Acutalibacter sp. 1XD8-36]|uniref:DUF5711 family protein n=1 Tax=Acutalibacter sp. 1XD8-36 TaxID=2320852 RepID=UPI0014136E5D|nr:DUF5711 family protein [Acutalibacter sp. 1XD8-36]NBJ88740.1 hypothetical protein [Acutalibacter sp. 1XD8-36]